MINQLNKRQVDILEKIPTKEGVSSSDVFKTLNQRVSLVTIKRDLDNLV